MSNALIVKYIASAELYSVAEEILNLVFKNKVLWEKWDMFSEYESQNRSLLQLALQGYTREQEIMSWIKE